MIKKLPITCFLCFMLTKALFAQNTEEKKFKYGKIESQEFSLKPTGKDSAAAALVLFDVGEVSFSISSSGGWNYTFRRHKRIKIMTKDGYDYANFEIPIYKSNSLKESLSGVSVAAYNLENNKIVQNKALKDEKFADKYDKNWTVNKYTLSNIKPGTIVEIKYEIQSEDIYNLRSWYFQQEIPSLYSDFTLTIPEYFSYKMNGQTLVPVELLSTKTVQQQFNGLVSNGTQGSQNYNFTCNSLERRWISSNIYAFKDEPFITTSDDYISMIEFELMSTSFPQDIVRNYSTTWSKIVEDLMDSDSFGGLLKSNNYINDLASTLYKKEDSSIVKMQKIYDYVKKSVKWNDKNNIYASQKTNKNIIESKNGNCADINLSLVNLLQSADLNAFPVLLSTRSHGKHPGVPMVSKFNYVIAAVNIDSNIFYLDATNPYYFTNCPSKEALNHQGLWINCKNRTGEWLKIEPNGISKSIISNIFTLNNDLQLIGKINNYKTNYDAYSALKKYKSIANEEEYLKSVAKDKNGLKIDSILNYPNEENGTYAEALNVTINDWVEEAGNLLYFNPFLYERTKENPFKADERLFSVDFATPEEEDYKFLFTIPEGYEVDKLPESFYMKLEDNSASFIYRVIKSENQILINSKISIQGTVYPAERFFELKELFKNIVNKQAEPIVLKKI